MISVFQNMGISETAQADRLNQDSHKQQDSSRYWKKTNIFTTADFELSDKDTQTGAEAVLGKILQLPLWSDV